MSEHYEEIEFKEINRTKKVRKKKNYLLRILIVFCILVGIGVFLSSGFFDIKDIEISGNQYYKDEEVLNLSGAETGKNIFWGAGSGAIRDTLEKEPYFAEVKVKRKLPSTLLIEVKERKQIAAIVYGDQYLVIDKEGIMLRKGSLDPKITLLTGLTVSKMKLGEPVEAEESTTLASTLSVLDAMAGGDIYFKKIDVSSIVIKAYIYDTLVVKGTPKQMKKAIDSGDLQKVVNNLLKSDMIRGTIKLGDHNYMSVSPEF